MADIEKQNPELHAVAPEIKKPAPEAPEAAPVTEVAEVGQEAAENFPDEERGGGRKGEKEAVPVQPAPAPVPAAYVDFPEPKDPLTQKIEGIMEEDLKEMYQSMNPKQQAEFRKRGEEVADQINKMVHGGKVAIRKIVKLIRGWLSMIPGVNKFFLEQEAKIKTDKIVLATEEEKRRRENMI